MGRTPCCSKVGMHRGPWTPREDTLLTKYIQSHGEGHWRSLPKKAGLLRCGKSCRLRWMNYLRPDIKRGNITADEDDLIIRMHSLLGNRWSLIAGRLPGRTDNEIKNYWNTHLSKRLRMQGTDPITHKKLPNSATAKPLTCKRQKKGKSEAIERPKVHLPRPVRFTPIQPQFHSSEEDIKSDSLSAEMQWLDVNNDMSFLVGEDDPIVAASGMIDDQPQPPGDTNLERLYEEYWQLLRPDDDDGLSLDSFAESLLL